MIYQDKIKISTKGFCDVIDITKNVEEIVSKSSTKDGLALIFVTGSTAGITTIEYEPYLIKDFQEFIKELIPSDKNYHHNKKWGDGNGFSHLRASLLGPSLTASIEDNRLNIGTWQQIVLCDFDNRSREREIIVKIIS